MPKEPTDPDAPEWVQQCLAEVRAVLPDSEFLPNRSFHSIELEGEGLETRIFIRYTEFEGTEVTRSFGLWTNPMYSRRDGNRWDAGSIARLIEDSIREA